MQSPLLAVQELDARHDTMLIYALALTAAAPTPLTEAHQRDIGCVAVIGIIAHEQREGKAAAKGFPDVRETGKRWAGIVGQRVMDESGQPREVVAFAMKAAVEAEQVSVSNAMDSSAFAYRRVTECSAIMATQLATVDVTTRGATIDSSQSILAAEPALSGPTPSIIIAVPEFRMTADGRRILVIAGRIVNSSDQTVLRPLVSVELKDAGGRTVFVTQLKLKPANMVPDEFVEFSEAFADVPATATTATLSWK
jgi:hypothetical protein